jgi:hypothetical protein
MNAGAAKRDGSRKAPVIGQDDESSAPVLHCRLHRNRRGEGIGCDSRRAHTFVFRLRFVELRLGSAGHENARKLGAECEEPRCFNISPQLQLGDAPQQEFCCEELPLHRASYALIAARAVSFAAQ